MILDQTYDYTVRSVTLTDAGALESFDSSSIRVTNRDVYPPKAPSELTAISGQEYISLVWVPNTETDLAGYSVYRRSNSAEYQKLTEKLITTASFLDQTVEIGKRYQYRVKTVDTHGNESSFSEEVEEQVEQKSPIGAF